MFDSKDELIQKIRLGEDSLLELKAVRLSGTKVAGPGRDELADELAAFANSKDGVVVLGVDDKKREVEGIPIDKLDGVETFIRDLCNDSIKPPLLASIIRMELPDAAGTMKAILKIDVPKSLFVHKSPGGYFTRLGSSKRELAPDMLARLFQQRSQARLIRFEEQAVPDTSIKDLSEKLWRRFAGRSAESDEIVLEKRGLLVREESGALRASVVGVLMASENPEKFLLGATIEAVRYRGGVPDSNYQLDAQRICGPLDEQIRLAMLFLRRNQAVFAIKAPYRLETPQYSERAVFEAIVNAVVHRDYSIYGSKIRFFIFDDRLEISSPGAPPNTVTVESLSLRQATRNELITRLLSECPVPETAGDVRRAYFMEKRGEGVPIILRESEALSGRKPEYRLIDDSELKLTIFAAKPQKI
ncbi:MAG: putative DNA binding domain-containing protein [Planctomycetes bacterium]|nr:putative DNA binding domain-containing protein [Planctomycetota bacterium]